jgi:hypothetical protein
MTPEEVRDKVLQGTRLAIERLIERKRKENGYIVVSQDGKVVKLWARDIKK